MKKSLRALPVTLFFLAAAGVGLVGFDPAHGSLRTHDTLGLQFMETGNPNGAQADGSGIAETKPVKKVDLVLLGSGNPGDPGRSGPFKLGFLIELEPDWHVYWANPGDAGLAPSARWTLPPGFKAGPLQYPVPRKSVEEDIVSFEHEGPVLLICDITPAESTRLRDEWEAAAVLEWMACRESCITGETAVRTVYPPDAAALEKGRSLLKIFAPRFPRPLSAAGLSVDTARAELSGAEWRVEIVLTGPRAAEAGDFFPYPLDDFVIAHSRITCRGGRIIVPLTPSRGPGAPPPQAIRGLVIIDGAGYEVAVPVDPRHLVPSLELNPFLSWR